jgi:hypothetical protein
MTKTPNASLLEALCVSGKPVTIHNHEFTVHELEAQMVGLLLLEMEMAANSGVAVISLLNPDSGSKEQYFKNSWWKIGVAAQDVVFTLIAFSLQEIERNEQGVPKAILDNVRRLPVSYLVPLLQAIAEANQSFFDGLQAAWTAAQQKTPGLSSVLNEMLGIQNAESDPAPNQNESAVDGLNTSPPSSEAAGQS